MKKLSNDYCLNEYTPDDLSKFYKIYSDGNKNNSSFVEKLKEFNVSEFDANMIWQGCVIWEFFLRL